MLILYTRTGCPFCTKVFNAASDLGIILEERNIADGKNLAELLKEGGKRQVPFLVDKERGISLYESDDIVEYLKSNVV